MRRSVNRLSEAPQQLLVLYGSQTGTAESFARMLGTFAGSHGFEPVVSSMNDAVTTLAQMKTKPAAVAFAVSTYGTGEFPSNANKFWDELQVGGALAGGTLEGVPYTVLGLGNSKNDEFNAAAKKLDSRMKMLGGKSLMRMQLSCELQQNGHDSSFRAWKRGLWAALGAGAGTATAAAKPTYQLTPVLGAKAEHAVRPHFTQALVHSNTRMTPKEASGNAAYLLRIQVDKKAQVEMLGRQATLTDQILVQPYNADALVDRALTRLMANGETVVEVMPLTGAAPSFVDGHKMTVRQLLQEVVDLSAIPSRSLLEVLAMHASNPAEAAELEELANDLSADSHYDKLTSGVFSIVDALEMFKSLDMSLAQLLSHAPLIAPRTYSMAVDPEMGKNDEFEIVYAVPTRKAAEGKHFGLCTGRMQEMTAGQKLLCQLVPSGIPLASEAAPTLYVALGSGIGPVRAQLEHRAVLKRQGKAVEKAVLFYGFRHSEEDKLFAEELTALEAEGIVEVHYVASHDQAAFVTPMDRFDASIKDFLGSAGEVVYCGLGGSAPLLVESSLRKVGVDVPLLRSLGRYHEEYFTPDLDMENLLKAHTGGNAAAATLAARMGNCEMFCFQCEQTFKNQGCHKTGVCGKTPRVAALQDLTVQGTKVLGFYAHQLRERGVEVPAVANRLTLYGLFTTLTNVNFDEDRFVDLVRELHATTQGLKKQFAETKPTEAQAAENRAEPIDVLAELEGKMSNADALVEMGKSYGVLTRFNDTETQNQAAVAEMLTYGLKGLAAYTDHSLMNGKEDPEIYAYLHKALAAMLGPEAGDLGALLGLCLEAGKTNVAAMSMLYESNKTLGVPEPTPAPIKPVEGKAILVSGHDLIILKALLEVTEPLGINVYTHGEMLPAFAYPDLKKHKNLAGHYGGAWMRQSIEFPHFPGPVLMTTNCLTEPHDTYRDRIFTAGAVGWNGVPHLGNTLAEMNFDTVIKAAQAADGFTATDKAFAYPDPVGQKRPEAYTVGFGHETVLSVAPALVEAIKAGDITRFYVIGGCDGYEGERSYYTELVRNLPPTSVVLTLGCGKFRINHLDLGTIGDTGIPRILDMGQCNDSFSAVQVALALADVFKCPVADLPISIVLSWFEQKAVVVLLSLLSLGLKPLRLGPTVPAFITPDVLNVLVNDFGIIPVGDPKEDIKAMTAVSGAS